MILDIAVNLGLAPFALRRGAGLEGRDIVLIRLDRLDCYRTNQINHDAKSWLKSM